MRRAAVLAALLACSACSGPGEAERPPLVLVTLDTARWDSYGTYGNPRARTPHFDRLARQRPEPVAGLRHNFVDLNIEIAEQFRAPIIRIRIAHAGALTDLFEP